MKISIVTLNFNGSEDTTKLLKSLDSQNDKDFETIIVDNASEKADFANLQQVIHIPTSQVGYPQVRVVRNSENLGFSGGNNAGIRQALNPSTRSGQETGSDWVVLLNNDTWVENGFIERLKAVLETKRGVVGIPLIEGDRIAYRGKVQWLRPTQEHEYGIKNYDPKFKIRNSKFYAIGGAVAIHKDVFEKIGLLGEKYFLYFEDADFSIRARRAGFDISIAENLSVHHHVSSSTKKLGSPLLLRYHYRNALYFNLKNGPWYIKLAVWPWSWWIILKQILKIMMRRNREQSKAILSGIADFYTGRLGKIQ